MRRIFFLLPFLLLFQTSYCDIVPENSHFVQKCVKITNIKDFPNFSIVACTQRPMERIVESYILNPNDCIEKGYKFNRLYIMATRRSYLESRPKGSIDWLNDRNIIESSISIDSGGGNVSNDNPMSSVEEYYEIVEITNTNFVIYKCKELIRYNDGRPITLKKYPFPEVRRKPKNHKTNEIPEIYPHTEIFNFLKVLLLTVFIETILLFLLFKTKYKTLQIENKLLLLTGVTTSFLTLPYVWFVFPAFIQSRIPYILYSECFAIVIESVLIYKLLKIEYKKALLVSILCNGISFLIGLILNSMSFL
ncbi:hypothetical protein [Flavobacterium sp. ABG]|uniref:hypothetical protein n=1 Tax=Flavobacterium sp. ABG TaxID=1423322 RepID=UPI00069957B8|nr:hypothetical protein [Flavobacterium sp. ABG]